MKPIRFFTALAITVLMLSGCSGMKPEQFAKHTPQLVLEDYFSGTVYAWGIFEDRFAQVKRQFQVDIQGTRDGNTLVLDEAFLFDDGEKDSRIWTITKHSDQHYTGTAGDVIGEAKGISAGNTLNWQYQMNLRVGDGSLEVTFDDWMFLQSGGVMINRAIVSKWGIELGRVTLFFVRADALKQAPFNLRD